MYEKFGAFWDVTDEDNRGQSPFVTKGNVTTSEPTGKPELDIS